MHRVNQWHSPRWIREWMVFATRAGDGWLWIALALYSCWRAGTGGSTLWARPCFSDRAGQLLFLVLKHWIGRERPCATEQHCWARCCRPTASHSLPGIRSRRSRWRCRSDSTTLRCLAGLIFCAMSIAASRVLLGLHYLSDVLAGIVIGCLVGLAAFSCWGRVYSDPVYNSRMRRSYAKPF